MQSAVIARHQGDNNPISSDVAESMKLLGNRLYGYQIVNRSRHSITRFMHDEKRHAAINDKMFKRWEHINDQLYEVELFKSEIESNKQTIVGIFILEYARLRMRELYFNFFTNFYGTGMYEEMEKDPDSMYLVLAEKELSDCIRS